MHGEATGQTSHAAPAPGRHQKPAIGTGRPVIFSPTRPWSGAGPQSLSRSTLRPAAHRPAAHTSHNALPAAANSSSGAGEAGANASPARGSTSVHDVLGDLGDHHEVRVATLADAKHRHDRTKRANKIRGMVKDRKSFQLVKHCSTMRRGSSQCTSCLALFLLW